MEATAAPPPTTPSAPPPPPQRRRAPPSAPRKRKQPPLLTSEDDASPPPAALPLRTPNDVRIIIHDEGRTTTRFAPWSSWTACLRDAGLPLSHWMPVSFNATGTVMTLCPTLECDSRHVMGSDVRAEVQLPTTTTTTAAAAAVSTASTTTTTTTTTPQDGIHQ
jgi:hypothetical protein